jgi:type VI secretion system protein ImpH
MTFRDELLAEPWRFDLFAVLRRLERENPRRPRIGDSRTLAEEFVTIGENPYFAFPDSNIDTAKIGPTGLVRLKARFLGMFGPQGALPLTTTEEAYGWLRERDDAFVEFVEIFQGRFLALFFRAWADSQPVAQHDRPDQDRFLAYIGSMIGIGTAAFRNADSISDFAKLQYAGLLAPRVKSASRLRSFLSNLLQTRIEIEEFVGAWLTLEPGEQTRLGAANSSLGVDCVAGASMYGVDDKFRVRVYVRNIEHFKRYLPGSPLALEIADAIFLYIGEEYDWDMEVAIPAGEITPVRLGQGVQLGWTSWMAPNWSKSDETIRRDAHFHVVSRLDRQRRGTATN